jgi:hypothetical protein
VVNISQFVENKSIALYHLGIYPNIYKEKEIFGVMMQSFSTAAPIL